MAINPLDDSDPELQQLIRERAYHLWEADGRPHGGDQDYWERARELVGIELAGPTGQVDPNQKVIEEEPALHDNLGEFPDRFADQGERQETPRPKARKQATSSALPVKREPVAEEAKKVRRKSIKKDE